MIRSIFVNSLFIVFLFGCVMPEELPIVPINKTTEVTPEQPIESTKPISETQPTEEPEEQEVDETEKQVDEGVEVVETKSCIVPKSNMIITTDSTFCKGTYYLTNKDQNDYIILVNTSDVTLDCNGATIIDTSNLTYVKAIAVRINRTANQVYELKNIVVKNCNLDGFSTGIDVANRHKSNPYGVNSRDRKKYLDFAEYLHDITIENNSIKVDYQGILADHSKDLLILNNKIEARYGVISHFSPGIKIKGNNIHSVDSAIQLLSISDGAVIQDNNLKSNWSGISVNDVGVEIKDNTITCLQYVNYTINDSTPVSVSEEQNSPFTTAINSNTYTCFRGSKPTNNVISGNKIINFKQAIIVGLLNNEPMNQSFIEDYEKQNNFVNVGKNIFPTYPLEHHPVAAASCQ